MKITKHPSLFRASLVAFMLLATAGLGRAQPDDGLAAPVMDRGPAPAAGDVAPGGADAAENADPLKLHIVNAAAMDARFLVARAAGHPAKAPTVVVVPGLGCAPEDYLQLTVFLTQAGFNVALFEEGIQYGTEEKPGTRGNHDMEASVWEKHLDDAMAALEAENKAPDSALHDSIDFDRLAIVGHSLGGSVATLAAAHDPRFKALVTFGPGGKETNFLDEARKVKAATLAIDGSLDRMTPPEKAGGVVVARSASAYKGHVVIKDGNHPNAPADYNAPYIRDSMKYWWTPTKLWPFWKMDYGFKVLDGPNDPKPIDGTKQKVIAFTYLIPWLNRFVAGIADTFGATNGLLGDHQVKDGTLTKAEFSDAARASLEPPVPAAKTVENAVDAARAARPSRTPGMIGGLVERDVAKDRDRVR